MHWFHRMFATPLFQVEDGANAGGADDGQDPGATGADAAEASTGETFDGDDDAGDAGDVEGREASGSGDDDDDDLLFGDDDAGDQRPPEERIQALAKKNNKLRRKYAGAKPVLAALREAGITEKNIHTILTNARQFQLLQQGGPEARKLINSIFADQDDDQSSGSGRREAPAGKGKEGEEPEFDESTLPFQTDNENGKFFLGEVKRTRKLEAEVARLSKALEDIQGGVNDYRQFKGETVKERTAQIAKSWDTAMQAAAKKITDPGKRDVFTDVCKMAYHRSGGKADVQQIVTHYLKKLGVNPTEAAMARGAAQQRIAQNNQQRTQHRTGGRGTPTPANGGQRPKTLQDVHRKIRTGTTG